MIYRADKKDIDTIVSIASLLYKGHSREALKNELFPILEKNDAAFFLCFENGECIGFAQCQLRYEYVEGTSSSPVGYLEGVFIKEEYRRRGWANTLLQSCQQWAKDMGCGEFASDCTLDNVKSYNFHIKNGFKEAEKIVCFVKKL